MKQKLNIYRFKQIYIYLLYRIIVSTKINNFRLQELEKKVEKHNSVVERTLVIEEQIKVANHRIQDLENAQHNRGNRA